MKRWLIDTFSGRLFLLMWATLVVSHMVAYAVGSWLYTPGPATPSSAESMVHVNKGAQNGRPVSPPLPTFPSLPPTPGLLDGASNGLGTPPPRPPGVDDGGLHPSPSQQRDLPWARLLLDYGIRLFIIALAAWLGARWLSRPIAHLAQASRALGKAVAQNQPPPTLDEKAGTSEVRDTARVFNEMSRQLHTQFKHRGLLVAALSHDLRTPLTRMRMRLARLPDDPHVDRCINDITDMDELINSALSLFRDAGASETLASTDVCSVVQSLTDDLIEQGLPVTFAGESAVTRCDPVLLRRVVSNLISNAVRYGQRAHVQIQQDAQTVYILVRDEGPGIPSDQIEAVFEPFFRLEGSRNRDTGGAGLGLYIARDLITRQGGQLRLGNQPQGGLVATVSLPLQHVSASTQNS